MSRKTNPPSDQGFGDLEDDFFNSSAEWGEDAPAGKPGEPKKVEPTKAETQPAADEVLGAAAKKAEADRVAAGAKAAAEARATEAKRAIEDAKRREEEARQATLDADARRVARSMQDQATRVYKRRSKEEMLAEEDAADAVVEAKPAEVAAEEKPVEAKSAKTKPPASPLVDVAPIAPPAPVGLPRLESSASEAETVELPGEPPPALTSQPTLMPHLPSITDEEAMETEVVTVPEADVAGAAAAAAAAPLTAAILAWSPPSDERAAWRVGVDALTRAAGRANGQEAALLFGAAAHLARTRAVDIELAAELAAKADAVGTKPEQLSWWRERVAVAMAAGDGESARAGFDGIAARSKGSGAAEAIVQSARVIRDQLGQDQLARAELVRSAGTVGDDPGLLIVLRELARAAGDADQELLALQGLARVQVPSVAAQVHLEIADLLERKLSRADEGLAAAQAARAADPTSGGVFVALERRLRAQGQWAALAELYGSEGQRLQADGQGDDAAWWLARSARVHRGQLVDEAGAGTMYAAAVAAAPQANDIRQEYHVWCAESEHYDELATSLRQSLDHVSDEAKSFVQYRLGMVLETRLARVEESLDAYRAAAEDPAAAPAAEAVLRVLQARGGWKELVTFLEARLARLDDPTLMVTVLYRMGETCEGPLSDHAAARQHYERVLDVAPGYLPALEGLERVYTRLGAWAELASVYEQRAILAEEPSAIALQRHRAGAVYDFRLGQAERAHEQYRIALDTVPDFAPSLDAYTRAMEQVGNWTDLARALRNAAHATKDSNEAVSLAYRAARVLADRTDDLSGASSCLQKALEVSPGFLPAVLLSKEIAARQNDWSAYHRLERAQAEMSDDVARRHWRLYAAAEAAQRLPDADPAQLVRDVLREDAAHPGAGNLAERMAWSQSDLAALVELFEKRAGATQDDAERMRSFVRLAELGADSGAGEALLRGLGEVLGATSVLGRPLGALARVAESAGYPEEALRALQEAGAGESVDAARLRQNALGDGDGAARVLVAAVERGGGADAASLLLRVGRDPAAKALAHNALAIGANDPRMTALHSTEEALIHEHLGDAAAAREAWWRAFNADPRPGRAFDGLRAALVRAQDADGLRRAFTLLEPADHSGLGDALEESGDPTGAVASWREAAAAAELKLPWLVRIERGLEAAEDWRGLLALLNDRLAGATGEDHDLLSSRARWLLSEKLTDSDEAWDAFRKLHGQRPDDGEVLDALARIAAARGEKTLAVQYLEQLVQRATSPSDAARLQRRRAEVFERGGDVAAAREALTRALDHQSDDKDALSSLRRLAESAGDWQSVIGVAARQAALSTGREQVDRFSEIARIWEERLGDGLVAADAWRKVLELAADDKEALKRLTSLTDAAGDWAAFVEYGRGYLAHLEGRDRATLLRRLGDACSQHLRKEDDAIRFYESATAGAHADGAAFAALERLLAARGEHARLVELLIRRSRSATSATEKSAALAKAARVKLDTQSDKAGAAAIYDELLAIEPDQQDALRFRGDYLFEAGDVGGAAALFARLEPSELATDRDDFDAQIEGAMFFYRFGESLRRSGDAVGAVARYQRALSFNANHLPTLEAIAPLHMATKQWADAERVLKLVMPLVQGVGNNDGLARAYARLGVCEFHLGHVDRARKRLSKAIEMKPNEVEALKGLGLVMAAQQDWNNLLNIYNNVIYHTHDPADVIESYLQKGLVLDVRLGMPDKAGQHYEKSLAFEANQPISLLRLAELALRRQDWPEAAAVVDRAMALTPTRDDVRAGLLLVRAVACQACGDSKAAGEGFAAAVEADATWSADVPGGIEDYEKAAERLRARIASGAL